MTPLERAALVVSLAGIVVICAGLTLCSPAHAQSASGARSASPWTLADCDRVGVLRAGSVFNVSTGARLWEPVCSYRTAVR